MENHSTAFSLPHITDPLLNGKGEQNASNLTTDSLESIIDNLLQKNTVLTKQLQKAVQKISQLRKQRCVLLDAIVKEDKSDYTDDDDNDSDLSAADIHSDIESEDESISREYLREEVPAVTVTAKRRKLQPPKRQRGKKTIDVKKDEAGDYIFPVLIGRTLLLSLGEIIPNENFYNQNYIFPVGYSMQRPYKSMVNVNDVTDYTCSIEKDDFNKPLFCIKAADAPDIIIQKNTPTAAWSEVLRKSNLLRKKEFKNTVSGPEYYGLSFGTIKKMIQELPGATECIGYQWVNDV